MTSIRRRLTPLLTVLSLGGCATHVVHRPLLAGDVVKVGGVGEQARVRAVSPGRVTLEMANGDSLVLRDNTSYAIRLREGKRGSGIIWKSAGIGTVLGVGIGVLAAGGASRAASEATVGPELTPLVGASAFLATTFSGFLGGVIAGGVVATFPHWYRVSRPVPIAAPGGAPPAP